MQPNSQHTPSFEEEQFRSTSYKSHSFYEAPEDNATSSGSNEYRHEGQSSLDLRSLLCRRVRGAGPNHATKPPPLNAAEARHLMPPPPPRHSLKTQSPQEKLPQRQRRKGIYRTM